MLNNNVNLNVVLLNNYSVFNSNNEEIKKNIFKKQMTNFKYNKTVFRQ